jgi:hypothetical protein
MALHFGWHRDDETLVMDRGLVVPGGFHLKASGFELLAAYGIPGTDCI